MKTREEKQKIKIEKEQKKDFEKYGIKVGEINYTKEKSVKKTYKPLFDCLKYVKEYKWHLFIIIFLAIFIAILSCGYPLTTQIMVDNIYNGNNETAFIFMCLFLGLSVITILLDVIWSIMSSYVSINVTKKLQKRLISDLTKTQINIFDKTNSGAIISRINSDTTTIIDSIMAVIDITFFILRSIGYLIVFFLINIWLGVILIASMIVYYIFDIIYQNVRFKFRKKESYLIDKSVGITNEIVRGVRDVKSLNISEAIKYKHSIIIGNKFKAMWDNVKKTKAVYTLKEIVFVICKFLCLGFAFLLLFKGQINIGSIVICLIYSGMSLDLILYFSRIKEQARISLVSAERINEIMTEAYPKEKFGDIVLKNVKGEIEFKDVDFGYKQDKLLFEKLNLKILPNECVGFVGKSGQGKSTIINLIPKLYEVNSGQILLDGTDIKKLTEESLRNNICVVSQTPYIFNFSIKENLLFAKADASDDEIQEVCKKAYINDFIESLPEKYETKIGEGGVQLSGGQRQRLAIARALLKNSKIILFDEATSALDNESQEKIQQAINEMKKEKTIIIVAHRLTTIKDCDNIFVLDNHKIVGEGTHKELMKTCNEYKNLYHNKEE